MKEILFCAAITEATYSTESSNQSTESILTYCISDEITSDVRFKENKFDLICVSESIGLFDSTIQYCMSLAVDSMQSTIIVIGRLRTLDLADDNFINRPTITLGEACKLSENQCLFMIRDHINL